MKNIRLLNDFIDLITEILPNVYKRIKWRMVKCDYSHR